MVGSDWPVAILAGDYLQVWTETARVLTLLGLDDEEKAALLGGTAVATYSIGDEA